MCRHFSFSAVSLALLCLSAGPLAAQTADEIVAKNLQAKGGIELLRSTSSVRMVGSINAQGEWAAADPGGRERWGTVSMTMTAKRPNLVRRDVSVEDRTSTIAFDGKTVWRKAGPMPPQAVGGAEAGDIKQQAEFDGVFIDYREKGRTVELVGRETLNGRPVHHLKISREGEPVQHYFLDAETGLESKVSVEADRGGTKMTVVTELSDYRKVQGRTMPFRMRQIVNGTPVADITLKKIEFDVPVEDTFFKMPGR